MSSLAVRARSPSIAPAVSTSRRGFFESLGGSLIHSRATHANIVERVAFEDNVSTFRMATNILGAGFIECIANETLLAIRDAQPAEMRGMAVMVPVLEANSIARIGRFGWKSQHASLESFSADAYLNEMGITSPIFPDENTSSGRFVGFGSPFDPVKDPEDDGVDIIAFANFMRSTKAPSRGPITRDVQAGKGCSIRWAAFRVTSRLCAPRLRVRQSMVTCSRCRTRSATRSFIRTVIFCCMTSARATAFPCCHARIRRDHQPDTHGAAVGAEDA